MTYVIYDIRYTITMTNCRILIKVLKIVFKHYYKNKRIYSFVERELSCNKKIIKYEFKNVHLCIKKLKIYG